jgi:hypothetical protein
LILFSIFSFLSGNIILNYLLFSVSLLLESILSIFSTQIYFVNSTIFIFLLLLCFYNFRLINNSNRLKERVLFSFVFVLLLQNIFFNLFIIVTNNTDGQLMLYRNNSIISFSVTIVLGIMLDLKNNRGSNRISIN